MKWLPWRGKKKELEEKNRERGRSSEPSQTAKIPDKEASLHGGSSAPRPSSSKKLRQDALLTPCYRGEVDRVAELIALNADTATSDALGNSPLHLAAFNGHLEVMRLLLDAHANPNTENGEKDTPLYMAVLSNNINCVKLIAEKDVKFNSSNVEGFAPLHYSAGEGNLEITRYLVEACNADPMAPDNLGLTPCFCAVLQGRANVTAYLLQSCPANVNVRNMASDTMLHCAMKAQHPDRDLIKLLLQYKSNMSAVGADGMTCHDMLLARGMKDLVEYGQRLTKEDDTKHSLPPADVVAVISDLGDASDAVGASDAAAASPDGGEASGDAAAAATQAGVASDEPSERKAVEEAPPAPPPQPAQIPWMRKYISAYIESHGASEIPAKPVFSDTELHSEWHLYKD